MGLDKGMRWICVYSPSLLTGSYPPYGRVHVILPATHVDQAGGVIIHPTQIVKVNPTAAGVGQYTLKHRSRLEAASHRIRHLIPGDGKIIPHLLKQSLSCTPEPE